MDLFVTICVLLFSFTLFLDKGHPQSWKSLNSCATTPQQLKFKPSNSVLGKWQEDSYFNQLFCPIQLNLKCYFLKMYLKSFHHIPRVASGVFVLIGLTHSCKSFCSQRFWSVMLLSRNQTCLCLFVYYMTGEQVKNKKGRHVPSNKQKILDIAGYCCLYPEMSCFGNKLIIINNKCIFYGNGMTMG